MCSEKQWERIRTQYITSDIAHRTLAAEHGVPYATLRDRAKREGWTIQRKEFRSKVGVETEQKLNELAVQQAEEIVGTRDWVKRSLIEVARRCMEPERVMLRQGREWVQAEDDEGNLVFRFDSAGANRALELVGKDVGMFVDQLKIMRELQDMTDEELLAIVEGKGCTGASGGAGVGETENDRG